MRTSVENLTRSSQLPTDRNVVLVGQVENAIVADGNLHGASEERAETGTLGNRAAQRRIIYLQICMCAQRANRPVEIDDARAVRVCAHGSDGQESVDAGIEGQRAIQLQRCTVAGS